eukprot:2114883-Rhodomonas_salina.4
MDMVVRISDLLRSEAEAKDLLVWQPTSLDGVAEEEDKPATRSVRWQDDGEGDGGVQPDEGGGNTAAETAADNTALLAAEKRRARLLGRRAGSDSDLKRRGTPELMSEVALATALAMIEQRRREQEEQAAAERLAWIEAMEAEGETSSLGGVSSAFGGSVWSEQISGAIAEGVCWAGGLLRGCLARSLGRRCHGACWSCLQRTDLALVFAAELGVLDSAESRVASVKSGPSSRTGGRSALSSAAPPRGRPLLPGGRAQVSSPIYSAKSNNFLCRFKRFDAMRDRSPSPQRAGTVQSGNESNISRGTKFPRLTPPSSATTRGVDAAQPELPAAEQQFGSQAVAFQDEEDGRSTPSLPPITKVREVN